MYTHASRADRWNELESDVQTLGEEPEWDEEVFGREVFKPNLRFTEFPRRPSPVLTRPRVVPTVFDYIQSLKKEQ